VAALGAGDATALGGELFNRLEDSAFRLWPELQVVKGKLEALDFLSVLMCGSGGSFFGMAHDLGHATRLAKLIEGMNLGKTYVVTAYPAHS